MSKFYDSVLDRQGNALSGIDVSVYSNFATLTLASLTDEDSIAIGNPVTTDINGYFEFHTAAATYTLTFTLNGVTVRDPLEVQVGGEKGETGATGATGPQGASGAGTGDMLAAQNLNDLANKATARTNLGVAIGTNVQAWDADLDTWATVTPSANGKSLVAAANYAAMRTALGLVIGTDVEAHSAALSAITADANNGVKPTESIIIAASDESTAITAGTGKVTFRMPYAFTVTGVRASLLVAQSSGTIFTVDINEGGTTILSTKLTIDNTEKSSTTAAAPPVISDAALADDAEMTVDVDSVGSGTAKGLKIIIIGHR